MQAWQQRPLDAIYAAVFIDAIVARIRDGPVANRPACAAIGVTLDGGKDILGLWAGTGGEGAKFWMAVLTDIRNRGVKDVFFLVCDGLKGLPEVVANVWPLTTVQTCIIHLIRNTFRLTSKRDWDALKRHVKPACTAVNAAAARTALDDLAEAWGKRYPAVVRLWGERPGGVHPVPGLRRGDPARHLPGERDRVTQRPLPQSCQGARALPERHSRPEVPLPPHQSPRPHRTRQSTLGNQMEARTKRIRYSFPRKNQLNQPSHIHR
jgi:putative transposase